MFGWQPRTPVRTDDLATISASPVARRGGAASQPGLQLAGIERLLPAINVPGETSCVAGG
jgi:hypothetical protein